MTPQYGITTLKYLKTHTERDLVALMITTEKWLQPKKGSPLTGQSDWGGGGGGFNHMLYCSVTEDKLLILSLKADLTP